MNNLTKQQGVTILTLLTSAVVVVLAGLLIIRFLPVYVQHYNVVGSAKALKQLPDEVYVGPPNLVVMKLKESLLKQLEINEVDHIPADSIHFSVVSGGYEVRITYDAQIKVFANIDAVIHFDNAVMVPKRAS